MMKTKARKKPTIREIKELGEDLVAAITNAAWIDGEGHKNLSGPTWHMTRAVQNWREVIR